MRRLSFCALLIVVTLLGGGIAFGQNLVLNGGFEAGSANWLVWDSPQAWPTGVFGHDYGSGGTVWIPAPYPYAGSNTHSQAVGTNNVHGGIYQWVNVVPGRTYTVSGVWSGGVGSQNPSANTIASWFEVTIYDGAVGAGLIDAAPGPNDVIIAKREWNSSFAGDFYSFGWEPFSGTFTAISTQVTFAFKAGKVGDWDAIAIYHDDLMIEAVPQEVPALSIWGMVVFLALACAGSVLYIRRRNTA